MKIFLIVSGGILAMAILLLLVGLILARLGTPQTADVELGVTGGRFVACPGTPNCVSTMADGDTHVVEPLTYRGSQGEAMDAALEALRSLPRVRIIREVEDYARAEARTALFRFIDDIEIYIPDGRNVVHFRSASRAGGGDMGVNRRRYREFRRRFQRAMGQQ